MADSDCQGGFCVALNGSGMVCAGQPPTLAAGTAACTPFVGK
jgi:hypothetical protein